MSNSNECGQSGGNRAGRTYTNGGLAERGRSDYRDVWRGETRARSDARAASGGGDRRMTVLDRRAVASHRVVRRTEKQQRSYVVRRALITADVIGIVTAFYLAAAIYPSGHPGKLAPTVETRALRACSSRLAPPLPAPRPLRPRCRAGRPVHCRRRLRGRPGRDARCLGGRNPRARHRVRVARAGPARTVLDSRDHVRDDDAGDRKGVLPHPAELRAARRRRRRRRCRPARRAEDPATPRIWAGRRSASSTATRRAGARTLPVSSRSGSLEELDGDRRRSRRRPRHRRLLA